MDGTWSTCYKRYAADIIRLSYLFLKDKAWAEDVCQEVFVRCISKKVVLAEGKEKAFLFKCAANLCRDELKSARARRVEPMEELPQPTVYGSERDTEVLSAVISLELPLRMVFVLHDYQGFTLQETSGMLHIPAGTAAGRLRKARQVLAETLKEEVCINE